MQSLVVDGGFAEPVVEAQRSFRALMDALANPGTIQKLDFELMPPAPLSRELAAVALTLGDHDTPIWLDPVLAEADAVVAWLRFHTGAPIVADPAEAHFALAADAAAVPAFAHFAAGSDEYPDRSTTLVLAISSLVDGERLTLKGPGIKGQTNASLSGLPPDFVAQWEQNRELFPRGVDLLLVADGQVLGLPRTTRVSAGGQ